MATQRAPSRHVRADLFRDNRSMDSVTNLRTFLAVVQHGGFSGAARHLHVVPSVVGKRIGQLEKTVGARLFDRTTRSVVLSDAGQRLKAHAGAAVGVFDELVDAVRRDEGKLEGHIRLMAPTTLTTLVLGQALVGFLAKHERISLEVSLADRSVNPLEQSFDVVVSGRAAHYEGVIQIPLAPIDYALCGAPAYLSRHAPPVHPTDLTDHACLMFQPAGTTWTFRSPRGLVHVEVRPRLTADDNRTLLLAAQSGLGIALLPGYICRGALKAGRLVELLPDFPPQESWFKAYVPRRQAQLARIKALCGWLSQAMEQLPQRAIEGLDLEGDLPDRATAQSSAPSRKSRRR